MSKRTLYFADYRCVKALDPNEYETYSISLTKPKWYKGKRCRKLQPIYSLMTFYNSISEPDEEDKKMYSESYYREVLEKLDPDTLVQSLNSDKNIVFLTYEGVNSFGHKEAIKQWFIANDYECINLFPIK